MKCRGKKKKQGIIGSEKLLDTPVPRRVQKEVSAFRGEETQGLQMRKPQGVCARLGEGG